MVVVKDHCLKKKNRRREYMASLTTEQRSEKYGKKGKFFSDET